MISQMGYDDFMCWKCKEPILDGLEIFRSTTCSHCGTDLHSCMNCRFYEPGSHYDCHETIDELVSDKERSNFCDYFSAKTDFAPAQDGFGHQSQQKKQAARTAFDNLFSL